MQGLTDVDGRKHRFLRRFFFFRQKHAFFVLFFCNLQLIFCKLRRFGPPKLHPRWPDTRCHL